MTKPRFQCGAYDVSPEHPSDWTVKPLLAISEKDSLDGSRLKDVLWRKYEYVLVWDAMSKTDYDNLETLFNYSHDTPANITFTYPKWSQSASGATVVGRLSDRGRAGGSGSSIFYSKVTIVLTEISKR